MSTVIVLLPARDVFATRDWDTYAFPFALVPRNGYREIETGFATLKTLPGATSTILIVAARDTLMLAAVLPPVQGVRLRRMLPNVVEEHLMQDAQQCHFAIAPAARGEAIRCIAVVDREWFGLVLDRFAEAGHRRVRAVPLAQCLPVQQVGDGTALIDAVSEPEDELSAEPVADAEPNAIPATETVRDNAQDEALKRITALIVPVAQGIPVAAGDIALPYAAAPETETEDKRFELAWRRGALGFGFSVGATQLDTTLKHLSHDAKLTVYQLQYDNAPVTPDADASTLKTLSWQTLARSAIACRFDLCQFEFGSSGRGGAAARIRRWRMPLAIVAASVVVALATVNVQWLRLRHQRDALTETMAQLAQEALPPTTVMLDPHAQMASQLARMRAAAGELRADDFLTLSAGVAHALGPIPAASMVSLNYSGGALEVSFKTGTDVDRDAFVRRLAAQGIAAHLEEGKWTLKPSPSGTR
ncbi:type II secretion system protein GspL [Paraburkholderia fungorum]|uniref:type II secretion system protein GspL n=1 Tax=Paraburkholderia fungorum TaxID=134537 RepID=UPI0038BCC845